MLPVIASSLISGAFNTAQQSQMLQQQKQENELSFKRNMQLAQQQNAMNIAQWNRENEYNLPINQIKRLKEAGLSPALLYKNGTSGLSSATSPSMSAGAPYNPVDMTMGGNRKTIGDVIQNTINNSLTSAQVDLMRSEAEKNRSETYGINIENDVKEKTLLAHSEAEIEEILSRAGVNNANIPLIAQTIEKFKKECDVFDSVIKVNFANIDNMTFNQFVKTIELKMQNALNNATIREKLSNTALNFAEVKRIAEILPFVLQEYIVRIKSIAADTDESIQRRKLLYEEMCTEIARRANIEKDTLLKNNEAAVAYEKYESLKAGNVKAKDQASRYQSLWGINKDILFTIDMLLGGDITDAVSKIPQDKDK